LTSLTVVEEVVTTCRSMTRVISGYTGVSDAVEHVTAGGLWEELMKPFLCSVILFSWTFFWIASIAVGEDAQHLFFIERSKNKNIVRYDAHTMKDGNLARETPMLIYWILGNGEKEELTKIQRRFAYGIESQKSLGNNRYEVVLSVFKKRRITVKKTGDGYRAFAFIDGRESILERIYVEARETLIGLPQILYVDLFGRSGKENLAVTERLFP
jgi:hypothetical protein